MSTILKTPGSVKHEGSATRMWQKEDICHALTTAAFTSSCQAKFRSLFSGPPGHHCLQPPHGVEDGTVSTYSYLHLVAFATFFSTSPVFSAWHCVFHAPAFDATGNFCHAGGWHLRRKSCVQLLYVPLFPCGIIASRFRVLVACTPCSLLLWTLTKPMWNVTEFRRFARNFL